MSDRNLGVIGVGRPFVERGATDVQSPATVASACEIVITCLPTPAVVHKVALGPAGVIEGSRVKIFIDMSTTGATYAKKVAEGLSAKGIKSVDAPISGGLVGAEKGTLAVMVSGEEALIPRLKPIMEVFGTM